MIQKTKTITLGFAILFSISSCGQPSEAQFIVSEAVLTDELKQEIEVLKKRASLLYEDEDYSVRGTCSGEWGGSIWFKNKKTGIEYSSEATCPVSVNKLNGTYYVTASLGHMSGSCEVLEITQPDSMEVFRMPQPRKKHGKKTLYYVGDTESKSTRGIRKIVDKFDMLVLGSFVFQGELFHIVTDDNKTYVATIRGQEFSELKIITTENIFTYDQTVVRTSKRHLMIPIKGGYLDVFENQIVILKATDTH